MLSPMVQERILTPVNQFYCDCRPECTDSFFVPALITEMIMNDKTLFLIVGKHPVPDKAGEVVKSGKGYTIYRQK